MLFPITNSVSPSMNRQVIDRLSIVGRNPSVVPFVVQGAAGHTAAVFVSRMGVGGTGNIHEWQSSAGVSLTEITSTGRQIFRTASGVLGGLVYASASGDITVGFGGTDSRVTIGNYRVVIDAIQGNGFYQFSTDGITLSAGYVTLGEISHSGGVRFSPAARGSGSPSVMLITGGAHITLAASTESPDINFNLARTVQFATGALTTQRAFRIQAPTYGFVGASIITTAVTVDISGAPVAGTNATITNSYALRVNGKINFPDVDVDLSSTTGTKWGRVTDKQAWFGATPIIQPAHANQAAVTDSTGGVASFTLNDAGVVYSQANVNNNFATLARQINEIRNVLVNTGLMKGAV